VPAPQGGHHWFMSLTAFLIGGAIVTFLLLAGLAVIGYANRRRAPRYFLGEDPHATVSGPDQPTLPGLPE
jgi:hypothetical protein